MLVEEVNITQTLFFEAKSFKFCVLFAKFNNHDNGNKDDDDDDWC